MTKLRQYSRAKTIFSTNSARTTGQPLAKKNLGREYTLFTKINSKYKSAIFQQNKFLKINSKWTTDQYNTLEDNTGENLKEIG